MKAKTKIGTIEYYVKANRKDSREEELERNGGRWQQKTILIKIKKGVN